MVRECVKKPTKKHATKDTKKEYGQAEKEFEKLVLKNIPGWTAVWNMMVEDGKEMRKRKWGKNNPVNLQKKIRRKISELLDEEETLVELYKKAAEVAKKREEEFKGKTAILIQQIEKDKDLMKTL